MIWLLLEELRRPDDQGHDWYGWASNQMSHTLLGVLVSLYSPTYALPLAIALGGLKECADLVRVGLTRSTVLDSLQDLIFWGIGACLLTVEDKNLAVIALAFGLVCGIIPRARRVKKAG